jgi:hypothetical protein
MIELERIMALDKCIATILYISNEKEFLHTDSEAIKEFLMGEMAKVCPYLGMLQLDKFFAILLEKCYIAEVSTMIAVFIEERRVDKNF